MNVAITKRIEWIDITRGITIFLVVLGHSVAAQSSTAYFIYNFHMPLFFILSGYGFKPAPFTIFVTKKAHALLIPYVLLALCDLALNIADTMISQGTFLVADPAFLLAKQKLFAILYGVGNVPPSLAHIIQPIGMIWFFPALFLGNMVFWLCHTLTQKYGELTLLLLALTCSIAGKIMGSIFFLPWSMDIAFGAQLFFLFGFMAKKYDLFHRHPTKTIIAFALLFLTYTTYARAGVSLNDRTYGDMLLSFTTAILGTCLTIWIAQRCTQAHAKKIFLYLSSASTAITCFHGYFPLRYVWNLFHETWITLIPEAIQALELSAYYNFIDRWVAALVAYEIIRRVAKLFPSARPQPVR